MSAQWDIWLTSYNGEWESGTPDEVAVSSLDAPLNTISEPNWTKIQVIEINPDMPQAYNLETNASGDAGHNGAQYVEMEIETEPVDFAADMGYHDKINPIFSKNIVLLCLKPPGVTTNVYDRWEQVHAADNCLAVALKSKRQNHDKENARKNFSLVLRSRSLR